MCAAIVVAFAVMVAVECVLCNMPFWRSLTASGDSAAAYNVLGPGLERTDEGLLKVTDPTQAYMQVDADGSSEYVRMDPVSSKALDKAARQSEQVLRTVRVRPDVNRRPVRSVRCRCLRRVRCMCMRRLQVVRCACGLSSRRVR